MTFFCCVQKREKEDNQELPSTVHGVPSIRIRRAKNESSSHRRGLWVLKTWDFSKDSNEEFEKSKVLGLGSVLGTSYDYYYAPRGREFFILRFIFYFLAEKWSDVLVPVGRPSPRQTVLCLGEDKGHPQEEGCLRLGEGMYA